MIKKYITLRLVLGIVIGAIAGYGYYYYIGCYSGTCPITSNPYNTIAYGALLGGVLMFKNPKEGKKNASDTESDSSEN